MHGRTFLLHNSFGKSKLAIVGWFSADSGRDSAARLELELISTVTNPHAPAIQDRFCVPKNRRFLMFLRNSTESRFGFLDTVNPESLCHSHWNRSL
jgi:hypothetical protein